MQKNTKDLCKEIELMICLIPGIIEFKSINPETGIDDYLIVDFNEDNEINIKIGLILSRNINVYNFSKQINEILEFNLNKKNIVISGMSIYIKGVK